jgi:hypothetical protein
MCHAGAGTAGSRLDGYALEPGAADCTAHSPPPQQLHRYDAQTHVLRENLCATGEAPFIYLLIGNAKAL